MKRRGEVPNVYEFVLGLNTIGEEIKRLRKSKGITQEELSLKVKTAKSDISRLERSGNNITMKRLIKIFQAMGAKITIIIEENDKS